MQRPVGAAPWGSPQPPTTSPGTRTGPADTQAEEVRQQVEGGSAEKWLLRVRRRGTGSGALELRVPEILPGFGGVGWPGDRLLGQPGSPQGWGELWIKDDVI